MLQNKVAIVTGASRGIGLAIAQRFLREGASVMFASRSGKAPVVEDSDHHERALSCTVDVANEADVKAMVAATMERFGPALHILVNNAGIQLGKTIETTTEAEWDEVMAVNLKGPFLCTKHALEPLRRAGGASVINIGSYDGFVADPQLAAYCASKGGVHALTRAIAVDHGAQGIRCNTICPGWIRTEMMQDYLQTQAQEGDAEQRILRQHPLGRLGEPRDIAALAAWLASDESSFATGQQYVHDGGLTAHAPYV